MDKISPGRKKQLRDLTQEEILFIIENYQDMSQENISDKGGMALQLVRKYMKENGLKRTYIKREPEGRELVMEKNGFFNEDAVNKLNITWLV